jgi:hypothetical protein
MVVCSTRRGTSHPARRPSAGAVPGRWGACSAVRAPPAALVEMLNQTNESPLRIAIRTLSHHHLHPRRRQTHRQSQTGRHCRSPRSCWSPTCSRCPARRRSNRTCRKCTRRTRLDQGRYMHGRRHRSCRRRCRGRRSNCRSNPASRRSSRSRCSFHRVARRPVCTPDSRPGIEASATSDIDRRGPYRGPAGEPRRSAAPAGPGERRPKRRRADETIRAGELASPPAISRIHQSDVSWFAPLHWEGNRFANTAVRSSGQSCLLSVNGRVPLRSGRRRFIRKRQNRLEPHGDVLHDDPLLVDQVADRRGEHPVLE